jgi:hypothetical protein
VGSIKVYSVYIGGQHKVPYRHIDKSGQSISFIRVELWQDAVNKNGTGQQVEMCVAIWRAVHTILEANRDIGLALNGK